MNPMNQGSKMVNVDGRHRTMLILWFAMLMSIGMFFVLVQVIERPPRGQSELGVLVWILMALGIMAFLASFLLKRKMLAQSVREQRPDLVQSAMILALALCEVTSLFGMVAYFTTGTPYYYIFFIISVVGELLHMPRRDQLLAASYKGAGLE
jgi:uncharacterized membrane protein